MIYKYEYPRPMVTVDAVIFGEKGDGSVEVLLIERKNPPYQGAWALPGGFIEMEETLHQSIIRELKEETGIENIELKQFYTFGNPERDPRGRTITIAYLAKIKKDFIKTKAGSDAKSLKWFNINELPELAFDHNDIIQKALEVESRKWKVLHA